MTITKRKGRTAAKVYGLKAAGDTEPGVFEAYVSVFGNVDYGGDRIKAGAFADSITRWKASGDPLPIIFSHQWDNLDAHIGKAIDMEEHLPGNPALPPELKDLGGLWVKFGLRMEEDFASKVATRLEDRSLKEFSFAYDVLRENRASDGVLDLEELDIFEAGPTLKGMNPATVLLAKALGDHPEDLTEDDVIDRLAKAIAARPPVEAKAQVSVDFEGSIEAELDAMYQAGLAWARGLDVGEGGFYALHQEATYPSDSRAIVCVEGWDDPWGEGTFYELSYAVDEDSGDLTVKEAAEIEVTVSVERKNLGSRRSHEGQKARSTVTPPTTGKAKGEPEEPRTGTKGNPGRLPALVELDVLELT